MPSDQDESSGVSQRKYLECMTWAGTGVLWSLASGTPRSVGIIGAATAAEPSGLAFPPDPATASVGFDKPANPNALGTLEEAINKIRSMPVKPSFIIHTRDITHLSKPSEFDDADRIISQARLDVHYVPGEHDVLDEDVKLYRDRYGRAPRAPAGTASTPTAYTSSVWSTSSTSRPAAWAILGTISSRGWRMTLKAARHRHRSSFSHTFHYGPSIQPGAGAPKTRRVRSTTSSASDR